MLREGQNYNPYFPGVAIAPVPVMSCPDTVPELIIAVEDQGDGDLDSERRLISGMPCTYLE